jgi:hypothetical protein
METYHGHLRLQTSLKLEIGRIKLSTGAVL